MKKGILIVFSLLMAFMVNTQLLAQCCGDKGHKCSTKCSEHSNKSDNSKVGLPSFKVFGKCDMCKSRIEKAALGVKGVKSANWNKSTQMLQVELSEGTKLEDVQKAVAKAGHDTELVKADDKTYKGLPACCKYRS
jgi:hypothetical protein